MAAPSPVTIDTLITIKLQYGNEQKRTKLPLKDLVPGVLPAKLRSLLAIPADQDVIFERYSDSAGAFIKLQDTEAGVYKQLFRAAKAKLKLRIRVNAAPVLAAPVFNATPVLAAPVSPSQPEMASTQGLTVTNPDLLAFEVEGMHIDEGFCRQQETLYQEHHARHREELERQNAVSGQLRGLHSYLNNLGDNIAQDYSTAFGGQLPSFLDAPAEPEMPRFPSPPFNAFSVCCNKCNYAIPDHHWHCGTCEEGDFDLCQQCLDNGNHCDVPDHFLVKRILENGKIISSTTEKASTSKPKLQPEVVEAPKETASEVANEVPGAFSRINEEFVSFHSQPSRTCNSCISIYEDSQFVTCKDCEDFDLCLACHADGKHGHHPAHTFVPALPEMVLDDEAAAACEPGRSYSHEAICDGCDLKIFGVRHKCFDCPDFDYCSSCHKSARFLHAGHRFAPIYGPLALERSGKLVVHAGIRCDGPLCSGRKWIVGDRYKCAICDDVDFCANCEALPTNPHNRTHPLLKFRTAVRNVNIKTHEDADDGKTTRIHGDAQPQASFCTRGTATTSSAPCVNAATQIEVESETKAQPAVVNVPQLEKDFNQLMSEEPIAAPLDAYYVRDYVPDGTKILPGKPIFQTWTMYNPGGTPWPKGCALRWAGGDTMLDVDVSVPGKISTYENATTSNHTATLVSQSQEYSFSVKLRAPEKIGHAISYWRLYTPDGTPFGHRLWCDVEVVDDLPEVEADTEKPDVKAEVKEEAVEEEAHEQLRESQMVFPKLEKESPASSTHLAVPQTNAQATVVAEEAEELLSHDDTESLVDDSLLVDDDDATDDGFFTDEDYDMVEDARP